ncbi:MAG: hypothetical protein V9H26_19775 [Verrucomicrobiota bacterium]
MVQKTEACNCGRLPCVMRWGQKGWASDADAFCLLLLLLALHAGDRASRGAADLGDDALLLVFRQVLYQRFVGVLERRVAN